MDFSIIKNALAVGADAFRAYEQHHATKEQPDLEKAKTNGDLAATLEQALGVAQEAEAVVSATSFPTMLAAGIEALVTAGQNGPDHGACTQISNVVIELQALLTKHPAAAPVPAAETQDDTKATDAPKAETDDAQAAAD